jgi:hypothetical protein
MERVQLRVRTPTVWCTYHLASTWISQLIRCDSIDTTVNLRRMGWRGKGSCSQELPSHQTAGTVPIRLEENGSSSISTKSVCKSVGCFSIVKNNPLPPTMPLFSLNKIDQRVGKRSLLNVSIGSRLAFTLLTFAAVCHASLLHDLTYKELDDRSFALNSNFASVASARDLYDLNEAQQVKNPRHMYVI